MSSPTSSTPDLAGVQLAYGCWRLAGSEGQPTTAATIACGHQAVLTALESGYTGFDLADIYGNGRCEEIFGRALRESRADRSLLYLATKCSIRRGGEPQPHSPYRYDASPEYLIASVEGSLRRLGVECVDLLMLHRPDYLLEPEEVAGAFARLQRAGKVREFGVSNFKPSQLTLLQKVCAQPLVTHQIEISLWCPEALEDGRLDQCQAEALVPMAWSPMAKGLLGDGPLSELNAENKMRVERIRAELDQLGHARCVGALAWLLRHPAGIVPVIGSTDPHRIRTARHALSLKLSHEEWYRLLAAALSSRLP